MGRADSNRRISNSGTPLRKSGLVRFRVMGGLVPQSLRHGKGESAPAASSFERPAHWSANGVWSIFPRADIAKHACLTAGNMDLTPTSRAPWPVHGAPMARRGTGPFFVNWRLQRRVPVPD